MIGYLPPSTLLVAAGLAGLSGCAAFGGGDEGDAKITAEVRALFDQYPVLGPPGVLTIHTLHGVVYLNGTVSTYLQADMAETVALRVPGVARVMNGIAAAGR